MFDKTQKIVDFHQIIISFTLLLYVQTGHSRWPSATLFLAFPVFHNKCNIQHRCHNFKQIRVLKTNERLMNGNTQESEQFELRQCHHDQRLRYAGCGGGGTNAGRAGIDESS